MNAELSGELKFEKQAIMKIVESYLNEHVLRDDIVVVGIELTETQMTVTVEPAAILKPA